MGKVYLEIWQEHELLLIKLFLNSQEHNVLANKGVLMGENGVWKRMRVGGIYS